MTERLRLPDVTLVCIETREHDLAQLALEDCERKVEFAEVLVFTDRPAQFLRADRRVIAVPDWPDKLGWSRCFWSEVAPHVRTSHSLSIQWDSWVVNPGAWRDEFLEYDYIGAPWSYNDGLNVGNGGFSLRSTPLKRFLRANLDRFPCTSCLDDDLLCRRYRPALAAEGFQWAPESVAGDFAFEGYRPASGRPFGFHGAFNFDYGCEDDEKRFIARVELMSRSPYIRGTYLWKNFIRKFTRFASAPEAPKVGNL